MLLLAFFGFLGVQAFSQKTITGTVTDAETGLTIPGVSVIVKGTNIGTVTDIDGKYMLKNVPDEATTLVFSMVGMKTTEVPITGNVVDCAMEKAEVAISDVVVTALGISREKKSLGYAVQEVGGEEISRVKTSNIVSSLSGKAAGVQVQTTGNFGGSVNIIVRGQASLTGNNQALFVIDGVPIDNTTFNTSYQARGGRGYDYGNAATDINPDDIESISILKGAAATALYGSRAANGVVLITTKKGKKGKALGVDISFNGMWGVVDKSTFPVYQQEYGAGYGQYYEDPTGYFLYRDIDGDGVEDLVAPVSEDASYGAKFSDSLMVYQWNSLYPGLPNYKKATPWVAAKHGPIYFFETSKSFVTSAQISGGTDKTTYRLSYQNQYQTGILPNSLLKKNNISFNATHKLTDKIKFTSFANFIYTDTKGRNETGYSGNIMSSFRQWWQVNVDILEQKEAYELLKYNVTWNPADPDDMKPIYWNNFYFQRYKNYETDKKARFIGYSQVDWDLTNFLTITGRAAIDYYYLLQEERLAVGSVAEAFGVDLSDVTSGYTVRTRKFMETNYDIFANLHKDFSENFTLRGVLGANFRHTDIYTLTASTQGGLIVPDLYALSNSKENPLAPVESNPRIQVNGYFANLSVGIMKFLFLEGSVRVDQSSTLPVNNNTYVYPSASVSLLFSEFLKEAKWLSLGKVRFNYAVVGNSAPFASINDVFLQQASFNGIPLFAVPSTKYNPELKPESTRSFETGLTMNFLNNRIGFDFALYKTNSFDQIIPVAVSNASGYVTKYINAGNIENKGIEITLNLTPIQTKSGFSWDINLNWSKNVNKVIELTEGVENLTLASLQGGISINARVGEPYGSIQGTDFLYAKDSNGKEIRTPENRLIFCNGLLDPQKLRSVHNGRYEKTATSDQIIGNIQPDWLAGIRNTLTFKNLSFTFLIDWKQGGDIFSLDLWYGMGTGLYPETVGLNDLKNPVRNPRLIDIAATQANNDPYHPVYLPETGGIILPGKVMIINNGDTTYVENKIRARMDFYANPFGWSMAPNALHIYDATYIKLREVAINYTLPQKWFKGTFINSVSVGLLGHNLWIIKKNLPYADPEASQGAGNIQGWSSGTLPSTRNFGFNINVKF